MAVATFKRDQIFDFLRPEQVDSLSETAELIKLKAGETVYEQGQKADCFFVVVKGLISLRLPGRPGVSILVDQLAKGDMFGSCISFEFDHYTLTARCTEDSEVLRIRASALKRLLDEDTVMGYAIQARISQIYFQRYVEATRKLQAIVSNIPLGAED